MKKKICIIIMLLFIGIPVLSQAKVSNGPVETRANVVVFAHFTGESDKEFFDNNREEILDLYEGEKPTSAKNYMDYISYGKFKMVNIFPQDDGTSLNSIELPFDIDDAYNGNIDTLIIDYIVNKIPNIGNTIVDYDGDGMIDNLSIVLKGGNKVNKSARFTSFINHETTYPGEKKIYGKNIGTFNMLNTYAIIESSATTGSGVIIHEYLHTLGYPDLYRNGVTDDNDLPVYVWDVMAVVDRRMTFPLAYERYYFSKWIDIDTITENGTYTLDTQSNANGNQAYIIKSPLNEYELFVVEFRKKGSSYAKDQNTIDAGIGGSGLIVYRIDTTVTSLSNYRGQTGIYVFRPQNDSTLTDEALKAYNAFYTSDVGRSSIGSSDVNAKLQDNALTFTDGSNSGIVISNIGSAKGDQITFDITIPKKEDYDIWENTNLNDLTGSGYKEINMEILDKKPYLVTVQGSTGNVYTQSLENDGTWKNFSTYKISEDIYGNTTANNGDELNLIYADGSKIYVLKWNKTTNSWNKQITINSDIGSYLDAKYINNKLYIVGISDETSEHRLFEVTGSEYKNLGVFYTGLAGQPKIDSINEKIYVSTRTSNNDILIYEYNGASFNLIKSANSNAYDIASLNNKLYLVLGTNGTQKLELNVYDGKEWSFVSSNINVNFPTLVASGGNLYVLATEDDTKAIVYSFNDKTNTFKQEGITVDNNTYEKSLISIDNNIYVAIIQNESFNIVVKTKKTVNKLISLSIVPPVKTSYIIGEKLDLNGIIVRANYTEETKDIDIANCKVTGFDEITKSGEYNITVEYAGVSNSFGIEVFENSAEVIEKKEGLIYEDGVYKYYKDNKFANDITKVVYINKEDRWVYVKNGILQNNIPEDVQWNENGWWYIKDGYVDFSYNGLATNENGTWVIENGKVNFDKTGVIYISDRWAYVKYGRLQDFIPEDVQWNENGWWYIKDGYVDFSYNGLATNENGTWVIENGKVNFNFTGYKYGHTIQNGKVIK